jgi:hypothetical protein
MYLMIVLLSAQYEPGEFLVTFRSITYQPDLSSPAVVIGSVVLRMKNPCSHMNCRDNIILSDTPKLLVPGTNV